MAVKTPTGLTERQNVENIVLQGDTWGSILASVQVDAIAKECVLAGLGYNYKDRLPISLLGLVDDTIGVTEAGFKATQMNTFMNVRTADKYLQFGADKCKYMVVGKNKDDLVDTELFVDNWAVEHKDNTTTGDSEIEEKFLGEIPMGRTEEHKYLGYVISSNWR